MLIIPSFIFFLSKRNNFESYPGIDGWVQPRLNLGFSWVLNPGNLGEPSEQVTQVTWVLEPSLPSLAGFIKANKKPGFSWICWIRYQSNKTLRAEFTGFQNPATSIQNDNYLEINFLTCRFPVGNFRKINQNHITSWACNSCFTHSFHMK